MSGLVYAIEGSEGIESERMFSVCSIVNNLNQYQEMLSSFREHGFSESNSEFLYIDNSQTNKYDCFHGLNKLMKRCTGRYLILCHQDIILLEDGASELVVCLEELNKTAPHWAVAGNAGVDENHKKHIIISDRHSKNRTEGSLPAIVSSLDENFLILKRDALLGFSRDLSGFHMYGTDICVQAALRGYSAHAINFHLHHLGLGSYSQAFFTCADEFEQKYSHAFKRRLIKTSCTKVLVGATRLEIFFRYLKKIRKRKLRLRHAASKKK
ncbi:MAG: hypothetical protein KAI17_02190 [Thiotrichaceae bacterium]|nr:hypothetical protein [Thiotrichaceae bacterium]